MRWIPWQAMCAWQILLVRSYDADSLKKRGFTMRWIPWQAMCASRSEQGPGK